MAGGMTVYVSFDDGEPPLAVEVSAEATVADLCEAAASAAEAAGRSVVGRSGRALSYSGRVLDPGSAEPVADTGICAQCVLQAGRQVRAFFDPLLRKGERISIESESKASSHMGPAWVRIVIEPPGAQVELTIRQQRNNSSYIGLVRAGLAPFIDPDKRLDSQLQQYSRRQPGDDAGRCASDVPTSPRRERPVFVRMTRIAAAIRDRVEAKMPSASVCTARLLVDLSAGTLCSADFPDIRCVAVGRDGEDEQDQPCELWIDAYANAEITILDVR
eukprot:TRINITY_DN18074_c0_g1_i2.p1 TRINITY_DN18074_c0_g1~~TRINITY_DN18074_c0_g1_i2.p1  ORF type:complete len:301 (+),score=40.62 TRINITY_DN18074_c0_g1_i2:82-903(+)